MYQLSPIYACVLGTFLGGIMMSVFWYYRKEDTDKANSLQFVNVCIHAHQVHNLFISCPLLILLLQMEIMASQHHDDISVACIDDKCIVLGLTEFCRYNVHLNEWFWILHVCTVYIHLPIHCIQHANHQVLLMMFKAWVFYVIGFYFILFYSCMPALICSMRIKISFSRSCFSAYLKAFLLVFIQRDNIICMLMLLKNMIVLCKLDCAHALCGHHSMTTYIDYI